MSDLRVAFIDQIGAASGGAEETLAVFLKHVRPGIVAHAILFEDGEFADRLRDLGIIVEVLDVPLAFSGSTRERMHFSGPLQVAKIGLTAAALLRRHHIQVAYTNSMKAHFVGSVAARITGIPCIMHFHDTIGGMGLMALRLAAILGSRERIACSEMVSRTIGVGKTSVIYGPVELSAYRKSPNRKAARERLGLPQELPIIALVGRINRWKGHDRFLRIAARVRIQSEAHFAIVGAPVFRDADFVPELHELAETLGLGAHVTFVPWLKDVREIYAACDINVNCSTREPFGRAIVEASACGVPTVCFDDSGAAETIINGANGITVPAGDEDAFATAILSLLKSPSERARLSQATRAATIRFDAKNVAEQMAAVIRRVAV